VRPAFRPPAGMAALRRRSALLAATRRAEGVGRGSRRKGRQTGRYERVAQRSHRQVQMCVSVERAQRAERIQDAFGRRSNAHDGSRRASDGPARCLGGWTWERFVRPVGGSGAGGASVRCTASADGAAADHGPARGSESAVRSIGATPPSAYGGCRRPPHSNLAEPHAIVVTRDRIDAAVGVRRCEVAQAVPAGSHPCVRPTCLPPGTHPPVVRRRVISRSRRRRPR
jgi:hypothetical protein